MLSVLFSLLEPIWLRERLADISSGGVVVSEEEDQG